MGTEACRGLASGCGAIVAIGLLGFFCLSWFWETTIAAMTAATMATTSRPVRTARMRLGRLDSAASESDDEPLSSLSGSTRMAMCSLVTSTWLKTPIFVAVSASSGLGRRADFAALSGSWNRSTVVMGRSSSAWTCWSARAKASAVG